MILPQSCLDPVLLGAWLWRAARPREVSLARVEDRPVSTSDPSGGSRLAGTPGRWRDFYGERSPADFDLDADQGVLCWNARLARADVLSGKKLHALFAMDWREIIYR